MAVKLNSAGGGSVTLDVPSTASTFSQTLPAVNGTVVTTGDTGSISTAMLATVNQPVGVGQTWQNVLSSRAFGTTYTNTTGRPIMVSVVATTLNTTSWTVTVGGVQIGYNAGSGASAYAPVTNTFVVPAGATYVVAIAAGSPTLSVWAELR